MSANNFKPLATGGSANVVTQSAYEALTALLANGFQPGIVESNQFNKVLRQSTFVAAAVAQLITDNGTDALDDGNLSTFVANLKTAIGAYSISVPRSYITGLTLSTAGSSGTMAIAAGQASNSTNAAMLTLAAAINKTTGSWTVGTGNGGLDTGTIANSTWYYFFLIRRPDTGVVDVCFSTSSSAPTLPANYTQYRYIGAGLTNGSAQWVKFTQVGDEFFWETPVMDFSGAGSTSAALQALSVPRGRKVKSFLTLSGATNQGVYLSDPANADLAPSSSAAPLAQWYLGSTSVTASEASCWTNTSGQIRHREIGSGTLYIVTLGWLDLRGKDL